MPTPAPRHPALVAVESAPLEEEEVSESEEHGVIEAWEDIRAGRVLTHEEVKRAWLGDPLADTSALSGTPLPRETRKLHDGARAGDRRYTGVVKLPVTLEHDGDWIVAECPSIPGCVSQGLTEEEAIANIREAVMGCLETRAELGMPLTVRTVDIDIQVA